MKELVLFFAGIFDKEEKRRLFFVFLLIVSQSIFDVVGVASIFPLISIISDQSMILTNPTLAWIYKKGGFESNEIFTLFIGVAMFALIFVANIIKATTAHAVFNFSYKMECDLGVKLMQKYLALPYREIAARNSVHFSKNILSETTQVTNGILLATIQMAAQFLLVIGLLGLLLLMNWQVTLFVSLTIGAIYALIFVVTRPILAKAGARRVKENARRFFVINEAFSGIKAVKAAHLERTYLARFIAPAKLYARDQVTAATLATIPRFLLEIVSFGGMLGLLFYLVWQKGGLIEALPIIAVYSFSVYRLMPAAQQIYRSMAIIKSARPSIELLFDDLQQLPIRQSSSMEGKTLEFDVELKLDSVSFSYAESKISTLNDVSISIKPNEVIGLAGQTGSGKTTTADIMLGLLKPKEGALMLDGQSLLANDSAGFGNFFGYVPQKIFICDDTVLANIAFGSAPEDIDIDKVMQVAKIAQMHDFISTDLPMKYHTMLGEDGVRLSGGQRQRIGIARALYNSPKLLVLDEATSALDTITERAVIAAVAQEHKNCAIVMIAHRINTLKFCDRIYVFDKGSVVAAGTYSELIKSSSVFQKLVRDDRYTTADDA